MYQPTGTNKTQLQPENGVYVVAYDSKYPNADGTRKPVYLLKCNKEYTGVADINQASIFKDYISAMAYASRLRYGNPRVEFHRLSINTTVCGMWTASTYQKVKTLA